MTFFDRTAYAFRRQVEEQLLFQASPANRLGQIGGMTVNGTAINVVRTPDQDRFEQGLAGYVLHKECFVDALRDDYTYANIMAGTSVIWLGISKLGLYSELIRPASPQKRPSVRMGNVVYQIFAMADDLNDATVKLTARRMQ